MSYAEPSPWSDVYVYGTSGWPYGADDKPVIVCESSGKSFVAKSAQEMWDHLRMHQRKGDKVPDKALERLWHEAKGLPYETDVERELRVLKGLRNE